MRPNPYWQKRSDAQLETTLKRACTTSQTDHRPILLAFSAPWCIDCKQIRLLEEEPKLRTELDQWHHIVIYI